MMLSMPLVPKPTYFVFSVCVLAVSFLSLQVTADEPSPPFDAAHTPIEGTVTNHIGSKVQNAIVCLVSDDHSRPVQKCHTDANGRFRFPEKIELPTTLVVTADSLSPQMKRLIEIADARSVSMRMLPGRRVRFAMTVTGGKPIKDVRVSSLLWGNRFGLQLRGKTDSLGRVTFRNAPASDVTYVFQHPKYYSIRKTVSPGSDVQPITLNPIAISNPSLAEHQAAIDAELLLATPKDPTVAELDESAASFEKQFEQSFVSDKWMNSAKLQFLPSPSAVGAPSLNGLRVTQARADAWSRSELLCKISLSGDFDVEADYMIESWEGEGGSVLVDVLLGGPSAPKARAICKVGPRGTTVNAQKQWQTSQGIQHEHHPLNQTGQAGTLRVARRGKTVTLLARDGFSDEERVIQQYELGSGTTQENGVRLIVAAPQDGGIQAVWKRVQIRAQRWRTKDEPFEKIATVSVLDRASNRVLRLCEATGGYETVGSPAWSPDQKWIAYDLSNGSTRDSRIMIVSAEGGPPQDIGFGSMPTFSPDGSMVAFTALGEGLGVMNRDGTQRRILTPDGWGLQWSPQPDRLSYSSGRQLYSIDLHSQTPSPLFQGNAAARYSSLNWNMCWSNDGTRIVFKGTRATGDGSDIAVFDTRQPDQIQVLVPNVEMQNVDFSWSPDDKRIMTFLSSQGGPVALHEIPSDGSEPASLVSFATEHLYLNGSVESPDGKKVALTGIEYYEQPRRLYRIDSDGANLRRITSSIDIPGDHTTPAVSPDGNHLAFETFTGNPRESHIIHLKSDGTSLLDLGLGGIPSFISDGTQLTYSSFSGLKLTPPQPDSAKVIPIRGTWTLKGSPVDKRMACIRNYTNSNLRVASDPGKVGIDLLQGDYATRYALIPYFFAWSPDGSEIAFIGIRPASQGRELVIVSTQGSDEGIEIVCDAALIDRDVAWHPDGRRLMVAKKESAGMPYRIGLLSRDEPTDFRSIPNQPDRADNKGPVYTRDGETIYFTSKPINR